ncbi:MAG TPA: SpoIVB peptidase S55 domain-containing protein, partial [Acidobacteriota bacterium]|nr:SpoIVB peptidase S55 domain-containing protein [Acidobacteriota bacterium]
MERGTGAVLAALLWLGSSLVGWAQAGEFFPLEDVRPGLKGVGKTVFQGTEVQTFDVEILGVLEKVGPNQSLVLAKLSGDKVNQYGVCAGMSGSPVYLDGRLLGAVAYAFS